MYWGDSQRNSHGPPCLPRDDGMLVRGRGGGCSPVGGYGKVERNGLEGSGESWSRSGEALAEVFVATEDWEDSECGRLLPLIRVRSSGGMICAVMLCDRTAIGRLSLLSSCMLFSPQDPLPRLLGGRDSC